MSEIGKVVDHQFDKVFDRQVELQARYVGENEYQSEWSFDGSNWNRHMKHYKNADDAIMFARSGAMLSHMHQNIVKRRTE